MAHIASYFTTFVLAKSRIFLYFFALFIEVVSGLSEMAFFVWGDVYMFDIRVIVLLTLEAALAFWLLWREGMMKKLKSLVICALLCAGAFLIRWAVLDYETLDYQNFLTHWVSFFRDNGGFKGLKYPVGNYNIPYLYFLAFFSYLDIRDLYLIKLLSIGFDILLAWSAMKLLSLFSSCPLRRTGIFFAVLYLPTVYLNGSLWAQCDSSYVALAVLALYLALSDRPVLSMVFIALSFGFKLQAVFVMPVFAVLWMYRKFNWKHFFVFPATYVLLVLPAVFFGRPFMETLTLYFNQTGSIGSGLNYNSPSVFAFFWRLQETEPAATIGIICAFAFMLLVLALCLFCSERLTDKAVLAASVLFAIGIPFLLPHMHDRYFFAADILTLVMAFAVPALSPAAVLTQFASLLGYHAYLKMRYLLYVDKGSYALIVALMFAGICMILGLTEKNKKIFKKGA